MSYGDVETLLTRWIDGVFGRSLAVVTEDELPSNLTYRLPLVSVGRFGGGDDTLTLDDANIDIDTYASTVAAAKDIARNIWSSVRLHLPGYSTGGLTVSRTRTISAPTKRDYQSTLVALVGASYQVTVHNHAITD